MDFKEKETDTAKIKINTKPGIWTQVCLSQCILSYHSATVTLVKHRKMQWRTPENTQGFTYIPLADMHNPHFWYHVYAHLTYLLKGRLQNYFRIFFP